ncbi:hypothetical protein VTO73DRAFT_9187 [Trametes versicolor]
MLMCDVPRVLYLLERSTSLEHLIIRGLFDAGTGGLMGTVTLARLKTFHLQRLSARVITALLSNIALPYKHMNISLCDYIPTHNALIAHHFPALQCLKRIQLTWKNGFRTLRAYRSSELIRSVAPALQCQATVPTDLVEGFLINWPIDRRRVAHRNRRHKRRLRRSASGAGTGMAMDDDAVGSACAENAARARGD